MKNLSCGSFRTTLFMVFEINTIMRISHSTFMFACFCLLLTTSSKIINFFMFVFLRAQWQQTLKLFLLLPFHNDQHKTTRSFSVCILCVRMGKWVKGRKVKMDEWWLNRLASVHFHTKHIESVAREISSIISVNKVQPSISLLYWAFHCASLLLVISHVKFHKNKNMKKKRKKNWINFPRNFHIWKINCTWNWRLKLSSNLALSIEKDTQ